MSIVAYYVEVDTVQLQALRAQPALLWQMRDDRRFAKASLIDIDTEWEVVSWLASPGKRAEQCHQIAWQAVSHSKAGGAASPEEFKKLAAKSVSKFGCPAEPTLTDPILAAIEGRGSPTQRVAELNFGLGPARLFPPAEVNMLAVAFSKFKLVDFQRSFNRATMARMQVGGMDWRTETDHVRDRFLVPAFKKVSDFYQRAAKLNHYVLVVYQ